jgi:hypothetical protein
MEITVNIPEGVVLQAKARGLRIEDYVEDLLSQLVAATAVSSSLPRTETEIQTWLKSMTQFSDKIPPLPETISREWIYR